MGLGRSGPDYDVFGCGTRRSPLAQHICNPKLAVGCSHAALESVVSEFLSGMIQGQSPQDTHCRAVRVAAGRAIQE